MDRLESQDVPAYTAPGLLPGLLALLMLAMGATLLMRSLRRAGTQTISWAATGVLGPAPGRALLTIGLCILFGTVLVGHGLPFWAAAALFVTASILLLRPNVDGQRIHARGILAAVLTGVGAGLAITAVFQWVFLVRLP